MSGVLSDLFVASSVLVCVLAKMAVTGFECYLWIVIAELNSPG